MTCMAAPEQTCIVKVILEHEEAFNLRQHISSAAPQCGGQLRTDARPAGDDEVAADRADRQLPLHRPGH